MDATLATVEALVRTTNYGTPRGFAVVPAWYHMNQVGGSTGLWQFEFAVISKSGCNKLDEHGSDFTVIVN
jgi:hypothetical protein